jgi:hypothetical protein
MERKWTREILDPVRQSNMELKEKKELIMNPMGVLFVYFNKQLG